MSRPFFAGEIFQGMGNFADGFDVSEVAEEGRKQTAMDNAAIAANNGRTSSAAMLGEAEIEAAKYSTDQGGFLENALPGIIQGVGGFAQIGMENGMFGGGNPVTSSHKGLEGFGPVKSGKGYGGFLDATQGTTGMGPLKSGDVYGSFLSRR